MGAHFSALAATEINGGQGPMAAMPDKRAVLAFACALGAEDSFVNPSASVWPCQPA